jgi:hypothetical protein
VRRALRLGLGGRGRGRELEVLGNARKMCWNGIDGGLVEIELLGGMSRIAMIPMAAS